MIRKNYKFVNEFLEKNFRDDLTLEQGLKIVGQALANNIDNPKKNSDFAVISKEGIRLLSEADVEGVFSTIEAE